MSTTIQNYYKATITRSWTATTGDFNVSVAPTPTSGWLVISPNNSTLREIVYYSAVGTNTYGAYVRISNVGDRGVGGTTAQTHTIGESVRMNITAEHWAEMQADINSIVAAGLPAGTEGKIMKYTSGAWVAGDLSDDQLKTITVNVTSNQIKNMWGTPIDCISAPGAGKLIVVEQCVCQLTAGTQYTAGQQFGLYYESDNTTPILAYNFADTVLYSATDYTAIRGISSVNGLSSISTNKKVQLHSTGGVTEYATGTGTVKLFIKYRIITL